MDKSGAKQLCHNVPDYNCESLRGNPIPGFFLHLYQQVSCLFLHINSDLRQRSINLRFHGQMKFSMGFLLHSSISQVAYLLHRYTASTDWWEVCCNSLEAL